MSQMQQNQQNPIHPHMMKDKDMLEDILTIEKHIAGVYNTSITESACQNLRQVLGSNMDETLKDQYDVFNEMSTRGFYQTKPANPQDITTAQQKYQQEQSQLN